MIRDDIINMAREAGFVNSDAANIYQCLEKFANLVAAAEREACADICDQHASIEGIAQRCAAAIRARSNQ